MTSLDLSKVNFTNYADVVEPGVTIFNPLFSIVNTLGGDDLLIGTSTLIDDFGFGVFIDVTAQNSNSSASVDLSSQATLYADGIHNQGIIITKEGQDVVTGTATAKIAAIAQTVSEALAFADTLDTSAIAQTFASIDIKVIANGIKNSGIIHTGQGNDSVNGDIQASVAAVATATADATAIVAAVAQAPLSEGLTAFTGAIAQSLAKATVTATGIKNIGGAIATSGGSDTISALATSQSATYAEASAFAFAAATPENEALALTVVEAIAQTQDKAIAIDNRRGYISLGLGDDIIEATAAASDQAIAIDNRQGNIRTGAGADTIYAQATGAESYGIYGGNIRTGAGADKVKASSFGGGVKIKMGRGDDWLEGFGEAEIYGGKGVDTLSLGSHSILDFLFNDNNISFGANSDVSFHLDGTTLYAKGFEQFNFAGGVAYTYDQLELASDVSFNLDGITL